MTPDEKQVLIEGFERSHQLLRQSVAAVSDAQFHAKPDSSRWSIGEIVEHLCILEHRVPGIIIPKCLAGDRYEEIDHTKDELAGAIRDRQTRLQAPIFVHPQICSNTATEGLEKFADLRSKTIAYVQGSSDDLRHYRAEHPIFGPIDGYQWLRNLAAHTERHVKQIEELKSAL